MAQIQTENTVKQERFIPFLERIESRRHEARKSIVVQVQSAQSYKELHSYCSTLGDVKQMFHYTVGVEPLVSYRNINDLKYFYVVLF